MYPWSKYSCSCCSSQAFKSNIQTFLVVLLRQKGLCDAFASESRLLNCVFVSVHWSFSLSADVCACVLDVVCRMSVCVSRFFCVCVAGCIHFFSTHSLAVPVPGCTSCQHASTQTKWVINPSSLNPVPRQTVRFHPSLSLSLCVFSFFLGYCLYIGL